MSHRPLSPDRAHVRPLDRHTRALDARRLHAGHFTGPIADVVEAANRQMDRFREAILPIVAEVEQVTHPTCQRMTVAAHRIRRRRQRRALSELLDLTRRRNAAELSDLLELVQGKAAAHAEPLPELVDHSDPAVLRGPPLCTRGRGSRHAPLGTWAADHSISSTVGHALGVSV